MSNKTQTPRAAVSAAIKAGQNDTAKISEALAVCFVALNTSRDTGEINRLLEWMADDGRRADMADVILLGREFCPLRQIKPENAGKDDWHTARLAFKGKNERKRDGEVWKTDVFRAEMDKAGGFRRLANTFKAKKSGAPAKLSDVLDSLAGGRRVAGYPETVVAAIKRAANAARKAEAEMRKAEADTEADAA